MSSQRDRDWSPDRSIGPTVRSAITAGQHCSVRAVGRLRRAWNWSCVQCEHAAGLLRKLVQPQECCLKFRTGSRCIKGPVRAVNEDRCFADQHRGLFIVTDGMGGHAGGERASQAAMEVIAASMSEVLDRPGFTKSDLVDALLASVTLANQELIELAQRDSSLRGMGATAVVGVVYGNQLLLCSVGDSRVYLFREQNLTQLTVDDTLVQGMVSAGALTALEAEKHPMRHVLLHSVGTRRIEKQLTVETVPLRRGDRLVFATDGLTDTLSLAELVERLSTPLDPHDLAVTLVDTAQEAGARDNITCVVVDLFV